MQPDRPQPPLTRQTAPTAFALRNIADRKARGRLRAAATAEAIGRELEWTDAEGWRYQLEAPPRVTISPKDNERAAATVDLWVWDATGALIFRDRIHAWDGFPVLVPDGSEHEEDDGQGGKVRVSNFRESPLEAARLDLAHTVRVVTKNGPWVKANPGTVSTFYGITGDGLVQSDSATYSTSRTYAGSLFAYTVDGSNIIVGQAFSSPTYSCYEGFLGFDSSALPDADEITAAVLSLYLILDFSTTDFTVQARLKTWTPSGLTTADGVSGASLPTPILATIDTSGIGATGAYKDFTNSGSNLVDNISKTGNTEMMLSSSRHEAGNTPTGDERVFWDDAEAAGTTQDPKLVVTHAAASVPFRRSLLGVGF